MAIVFLCDNCGEDYPARISVKGGIRLDTGDVLDSESDYCPNCQKDANKAKEEALQKRKKIV